MILGKLANLKNYCGIHPNLDKAIHFLEENEWEKLEAGSYRIDGENVYMNRFDYETGPESPALEGHRDYLDIHIVAGGREFLGYADAGDLAKLTEYDKEGDFLLYEGSPELKVLLEPGRFVICWPEDAHAPKICAGQPEKVRKAVVKVKL